MRWVQLLSFLIIFYYLFLLGKFYYTSFIHILCSFFLIPTLLINQYSGTSVSDAMPSMWQFIVCFSVLSALCSCFLVSKSLKDLPLLSLVSLLVYFHCLNYLDIEHNSCFFAYRASFYWVLAFVNIAWSSLWILLSTVNIWCSLFCVGACSILLRLLLKVCQHGPGV